MEAVRILEEKPGTIMNSKSGSSTHKISRISITVGEDVKERRDDRVDERRGGEDQMTTIPDKALENKHWEMCVWEVVGGGIEEEGCEERWG